MKKRMCGLIALTLLAVLLCTGGALAEQKVQLPESTYSVLMPDGMEYDGPGEKPEDECFAWVSEKLGLDIQFSRTPNDRGASLQAMLKVLSESDEVEEALICQINGIDMIVYRATDPQDEPGKGMKCIGYVFLDGDAAQMICFWYATQEAADLTAEIIGSITNKD